MEKAIIVSRCSTTESKQDVTRQTHDLTAKYSSLYKIEKVFEYYKSGQSNDEQLSEILAYATKNKIEQILFTEVSRIARRVIQTLVFIENCTKQKINVVIDGYNMNSLNPDKTEDLMTKTCLQIASCFSEMELRHIQSRLNSGRAKYIKNGGRLGRKTDSKERKEQTMEKHKDVIKYLKQGHSIRNTMKLTGKSNGTIQKIKQLISA